MNRKLIIFMFITFSLLLTAQAPEWQWATQAGGSIDDFGRAIAIDDNGNCYVSGYFNDTVTFGSYSLTCIGYYDAFIAKMDANGNWLWAIQAGGDGLDVGHAIAIDGNGNIYVTGEFQYTSTFGSYSLTSSGWVDIFIAKINEDGNWLWATKAGGSGLDYGQAITLDNNGNSYITGRFQHTSTFGSYSITTNGSNDIYIAKMDANGNWLWAMSAGGSDSDSADGITIDDYGNSYVTGGFEGTTTIGPHYLTSSGSYDIFAAKMDVNGNWLWATKAGGISFDMCHGIVIDENGDTYITGYFGDTATFGSYSLTSSGSNDIVTAKLDANGNWLWATKAGGNYEDASLALVIDDNGNSYVTGNFSGTAIFGSHSLTSSGHRDIFIAKIDTNGNWLWATKAGGISEERCFAIAKDDNDNSYVTGWFTNTATFGSYLLTSSGSYDIFVAKMGIDTSVENEIIPMKMELSNYPNPFNPITTISFSVTQNSDFVTLEIYNIKGQKIKTLTNEVLNAGDYSIIWNGDDELGKAVSSGVYLYKLRVNSKTEAVKKCLLLK